MLEYFSWFVVVIVLIGTIANTYQKRWCFWLWLFGNAFYIVYFWHFALYSQVILSAIYFALNILALTKWKAPSK